MCYNQHKQTKQCVFVLLLLGYFFFEAFCLANLVKMNVLEHSSVTPQTDGPLIVHVIDHPPHPLLWIITLDLFAPDHKEHYFKPTRTPPPSPTSLSSSRLKCKLLIYLPFVGPMGPPITKQFWFLPH